MKEFFRRIIRAMLAWPLIGRVIRIFVAVVHLPRMQAEFRHQVPFALNSVTELSQNQDGLLQHLQGLSQRQLTFETEQLPALLQTLSDLNNRLVERDKTVNHLMASVPVALRKITREQIAFNQQLATYDQQLATYDQQLAAYDQQLAAYDQQLAAYDQQLVNLSESAKYLFGRVEFVRRELMFEMRYSASDPLAGEVQLTAKPEIVSPEKLAEALKNKLQLNLGCGHLPLEGYLNVDRRALPGVDIVAEVDDLPLEPGEVDTIYSAHLLEHFPQEQLRRELLPYYFTLLKPGGELRAVVPDAEAMIREYSKGKYPYDDMREVLYGGQDYDGDFHFNMFTPESMGQLLQEGGFTDIKVVEAGRKNGKCFEFEISAVKPAATKVQ